MDFVPFQQVLMLAESLLDTSWHKIVVYPTFQLIVCFVLILYGSIDFVGHYFQLFRFNYKLDCVVPLVH
jgi:hypothetical protein